MARATNPESLYTDARGLTGSESTAVEYAKGLAAAGHDVTFFANVATEQAHGNLLFRNDANWDPAQAEQWDAIVAFMNAAPLMGITSTKPFCVFNMQCGDFGGQPVGWEDKVDLLCALSHTHAKEMKPTTALPAEKWRVMSNGVDTEAFKPGTKIPGRCIWASSHDRGLHHILEIWPNVRAAVPHAELHVFYDIQGLERFAKMGPTDVPFLQELQRRSIYEIEMMLRLRGHGVFLRNSVSREQMQREMAQAEVLAYPCDPVRFTETFGCTVLEAMSAGCVPVLCFADAFPELWQSRGCPGVEWPYEGHADEYEAKLVNALRHPQQWAPGLREKAQDFAWPGLVKKLERCIETRGAEGLERPEFSGEQVPEYVLYRPYHERAA
jgi:hypothetical protein